MKYKSTYQSKLTREQLIAYRNGGSEVQRATEGSVNDAFDQDALDGWSENGLTAASMSRLDRRFRLKKTTPYIIGVATLSLAVVLSILFWPESPQQLPAKQEVKLSMEQSDAVMPVAIDTMEELPASKQITILTLKNTQHEIKQQPESTPVTDIDELPTQILEPLKLDPIVETPAVSSQKSAKEIYLHDLKLIDYSQYRSKPTIQTERIVMTGTPADQEKRGTQEAESTTVTTVAIPYMDYIDKTMDYVGRGKWKQSLQRLQLILETYPDDVNGHFYAGLCCYNLQQYEDAKQHFATCLQLSFSNFNEEASWYLAQSLLANGEKTDAKELFSVIRDQKGYYAKQAEKMLKGIK
ncbi:MAG: hypothetical protein A3D31_18355 [Candidatus Fluviicola riflensis]|nr:MAG: hypothetical protein CHH17_03295 [Candidatus Fluviicola riflensis]OGS76937.1 MAG: hypothetical protein A3D31_18355 [Candidatus Fluviicola riflensis]OGS81866.1 MAG: hypothetical protein A2724_15755 [Fluviicola sp. RIFCSPHIGHO2_01_FULL_43_53]OGS88665.1 MAG: hypothetical protein A3E30_07860 [Fluviicola sp. RIFCSPHIGHO2_12_FULL_43_24]